MPSPQRHNTTDPGASRWSLPNHTLKEIIMPNRDLPQPTQPLDELNLAADMLQTVGLAAAAGIGTALVSGFVVVMLALHVA